MSIKKLADVVVSFPRVEILRKMFYAVASGRKTGVFDTWKECEEQVKGFTGAKFKKFSTLQEAQQFTGVQQSCTSANTIPPSLDQKGYKASSSNMPPRYFSSQPTSQDSSIPEGKSQKFYYAVAKGHHTGIYLSWAECKVQIDGFPYPKYKKFPSLQEAENFIKEPESNARISYQVKTGVASQGNFTKNNNAWENLSPVCFGGCQFSQDSEGYVHCFTDGSCEGNGCTNARAGIGVWFGSNHPLNVGEPVVGPPTNNIAEIQAATKAVLVASSYGIKNLQINTDSQFMIKCITQWMPNWKKNGWKLSSGGEVKNKEQLIELDKALKQGVHVKWNYVQAHIGIEGNEHADKLARAGAANYKAKSKVSESGRYKPY